MERTDMITRDMLVEVLSRGTGTDAPALDEAAVTQVADDCLHMLQTEIDVVRREILRVAADRISPIDGNHVFAGAPWDMGFHDGKAVAADALRLMARQ